MILLSNWQIYYVKNYFISLWTASWSKADIFTNQKCEIRLYQKKALIIIYLDRQYNSHKPKRNISCLVYSQVDCFFFYYCLYCATFAIKRYPKNFRREKNCSPLREKCSKSVRFFPCKFIDHVTRTKTLISIKIQCLQTTSNRSVCLR